MTISDIFNYKCLILFYKFKNNLLPDYISKIFSHYTAPNAYSLRSHENKILQEKYSNLKLTEKCLRYFLPKTINNLSEDCLILFNTNNINTFKIKLKKYILAKYSDSDCDILDCYPCMRRLFYPNFLSRFMQLINIFSYTFIR